MKANDPVLLFDVMDTLVVDPFPETFLEFFGMGEEEFIEEKSNDAWARFETAEIDEAEFFRIFFDHRDEPLRGEELKKRIFRAYRWVPGMQSLLVRLNQRGIPLHAFSNYPHWYRMIERKLALSRYLEWSFVSWHTGYRKPDPAAYRHVIDSLQVPPSSLLFVDNKKRNVEAARREGLRAHTFGGAGELTSRLAEMDLLPSTEPK